MIVRQQATDSAVTAMTYVGIPESVPAVRRFVRATVAHSPRVDDLELVAAELATNAICHTPSGREGGTFTITIHAEPGRARLEVTDLGDAPWRPAHRNGDGMAEHGRGLGIIAALADEIGRGIRADHRSVSWAVLSWLPGGTGGPPRSGEGGPGVDGAAWPAASAHASGGPLGFEHALHGRP
jgi:anti-sigma regulatory factor (Ser/Thr protein kinase)